MKNYKTVSVKDYMSPFNTYDFTKEQKEILKSLGFRYEEFFGVYQKSISWKCEGYTPKSVDLMIYKTNGDLIRFYDRRRHNTPAEMNEMYKSDYKYFMKAATPIIKELKANGIIR